MASESFGNSDSRSAARGSGTTAQTGGKGTDAKAKEAHRTVCAFWIGDRCFGLDTALVAEVVSVEERIPIPLAPSAVHGVFNLRGEPLPLISLADILSLHREATGPKAVTAMVLRSGELAAGLVIDRVQAIVPLEGKKLLPPANTAEDAAVLGFLELATERMTTIVSVLDPTHLLDRLMQLRYQREPIA